MCDMQTLLHGEEYTRVNWEQVLNEVLGNTFGLHVEKHVLAHEWNSHQPAECITHHTVVAITLFGLLSTNMLPHVTYQGYWMASGNQWMYWQMNRP